MRGTPPGWRKSHWRRNSTAFPRRKGDNDGWCEVPRPQPHYISSASKRVTVEQKKRLFLGCGQDVAWGYAQSRRNLFKSTQGHRLRFVEISGK